MFKKSFFPRYATLASWLMTVTPHASLIVHFIFSILSYKLNRSKVTRFKFKACHLKSFMIQLTPSGFYFWSFQIALKGFIHWQSWSSFFLSPNIHIRSYKYSWQITEYTFRRLYIRWYVWLETEMHLQLVLLNIYQVLSILESSHTANATANA